MSDVREQALNAKMAAPELALLRRNEKDMILEAMAQALLRDARVILQANANDLQAAQQRGTSKAMMDRLRLTEERIAGMAEGMRKVARLEDPTSQSLAGWQRPNGLRIEKRRVPLGVVGIIYEARPNVTADAVALCVKSGNACVLRGGSEAIHSNIAIIQSIVTAGEACGLPKGAVQLIADTSRASSMELMQLNGIVDVLIPRGGAGLIRSVLENASVPVIETGVGNCHIYVDASADLEMAAAIVVNAKCSRPSVCNAAEKLLVHEAIAPVFLPKVNAMLRAKEVTLRGSEQACAIDAQMEPAKEADWETEYNDLILSVKTVANLDEALAHIARYTTHHSEAIVTESIENAERFLNEVDAAAVYVNASTRFTDGEEFGFGAEIGISTQKLHARGPMGLNELTSMKYVVRGNGQIR